MHETHPIEDATLTHRIRGTAHNIAHRYGSNPEDVEQDLVLALLEAYVKDSDALNDPQTAVNYAANKVGWQHRKARQHKARNIKDKPVGDSPTAPTLTEVYATTNPWPAINLRLEVESALATLRPITRKVARGLSAGHRSREIGVALGISHQTVCNHHYQMLRLALA